MACLAAWIPAAPCSARNQFGAFQEFVTENSLKPFTRDLGSVLGSSTFHSGRILGFTGFDIGFKGAVQFRPSRRNDPLHRARVGAFGLPWVQAEIGLPFKLSGFIRGISFQGMTVAGGGLRYAPLKPVDVPWAPQFLISGVAHSAAHQDFSASHLGLNVVVSAGSQTVTPFVGAGIDRTRVVVRSVPALAPALAGEAVSTSESRFTAGVSLRPFPFTYLQGAFSLAHGQPGSELGLGVRF